MGNQIRSNVLNAHSYIPHPVKIKLLEENKYEFGIISIHTDTGAKEDHGNNMHLMTISEAHRARNYPRGSYFFECILGGVHGINVRDLLSGMDPNDQGLYCNLTDLNEKIDEEWKKTQDWEFHGDDLLSNLTRSGLLEYFPDIKLD